MGRSTPLVLAAAASMMLSGASATLDPIVIKGAKFFFNSNDTQFFIKGVAYQSGFNPSTSGSTSQNSSTKYVDPLADTTSCNRDIPYLKQLGVNTIRTYAIDPTADHSKCMSMLDDAGIYVISDMSEPATSIDRADPQWNTDLYTRYTAVVDSLAQYTNVIGFFAGNEVPNNLSYTGSTAMVKAAVRDTKAYIKSKNYRAGLGVGYAADDDATVRAQVSSYLNCGDSADSIDFWGYNIYEWCGDSSFTASGYDKRVQEFSNYNVPSFFAEYGCNTGNGVSGAADRKFTEVAAIYGDQMTPVFSGAIAYEYFEEANDYGMASVVNPSSVSTLKDFGTFETALASASPSGVQKGSYNPTNTAQACPPVGTNWNAATPLPPTPNKDVCKCMMDGLTCTAKSSVTSMDIGPLFDIIYAPAAKFNNSGIVRNTTTGIYGPYSMCSGTEQLAWAFDQYYKQQGSIATACDFGGNATVVKPSAASTCSGVIAAATSANPGTSVGSGGSSGGSSGAAASTSKKSDGGMIVGPSLGMAKTFIVGFTMAAAFSGGAMLLL